MRKSVHLVGLSHIVKQILIRTEECGFISGLRRETRGFLLANTIMNLRVP